eukprot:1506604-Amphidinium_carterae.1
MENELGRVMRQCHTNIGIEGLPCVKCPLASSGGEMQILMRSLRQPGLGVQLRPLQAASEHKLHEHVSPQPLAHQASHKGKRLLHDGAHYWAEAASELVRLAAQDTLDAVHQCFHGATLEVQLVQFAWNA